MKRRDFLSIAEGKRLPLATDHQTAATSFVEENGRRRCRFQGRSPGSCLLPPDREEHRETPDGCS
jgi:hypothetical protein